MQNIINIKAQLPVLTEKIISVFGSEYAGFIKQKIKNLPIIFYAYPDELKSDIYWKLHDKKEELIIKYLKFIHKYNPNEDLDTLIKNYICEDPFEKEKGGIFVFSTNDEQAKLKYINLIRGEELSEEDFNAFKHSLEYNLLCDLINLYIRYYYHFKEKYEKYKNKIDIIDEPLTKELERYDGILT